MVVQDYAPKDYSLLLSPTLSTSFFCCFHIPFNSNNTLGTLFTLVIHISKWPYANLCCGQLHAHVLAPEILSLHKDTYLFLNACGKGTHLFPLWFHYTLNQVYIVAAAGSNLYWRLAISQKYCANMTYRFLFFHARLE